MLNEAFNPTMLSEKAFLHIKKASEVLLSPLDTDIATTPYDVVYEEDRIKLKHYRPAAGTAQKAKTPLLVVYALVNRETMLDLQPGRSVLETFLNHGLEVYMIDWGYPTRKDRYLTIDDHVNGYLDNVVDVIRERHALASLNLMGICMGGTFCTMYAALHPEKVKNLVTTVSPTNFDTDRGLLHHWAQYIDADKIVDTFGNIPADILNFGFLLLNPAKLIIGKYDCLMENMASKPFVENFIRMEKWIFDSPDVPGETFRQFMKECYQENRLIKNEMMLDGQRVDLRKLTMPLLNIYAKHDHLVPPSACNRLSGKVGSTDTEDVCLDTGHIGIYVSAKSQNEFAPKIADWLMTREGAPKKPTPGKKTSGAKRSVRKAGAAAENKESKAAMPSSRKTPKKHPASRSAGR